MSVLWQIRLKKADGSLSEIIDHFAGFSFVQRVNTKGAYALRLDGNDAKCASFALDGQLEFWWRDLEHGIDWRKEFEAFHRNPDYYVTEKGALMFESSGPGYNHLLDRRIVEAAAGSSGGRKSGKAETICKAWVNEQCGPGAGARAIADLSMQADATTGNTIKLSRSRKKVLSVCQDIARIGGGDFAVVGTGAATYEFRWYNGQLGTDRSASVIFTLERGNMARPRLYYPRSNEVNAVLVAGQGAGTDRTTSWRTDASLIDDSPINRIESFKDARNTPDDGLDDVGDIVLDEGKPRQRLTFDVIQIAGCMFGKDYFLGDLCTAKFLDYEGTVKAMEVGVNVSEKGTTWKVGMENV